MSHKILRSFFPLIVCSNFLGAAEVPKASPRDLLDYIQEARKLGLNDEQILKNASSAGWDSATVERTYTAMRLLNNEKVEANPAANRNRQTGVPGEYRIGPGDTLQITVWKEPDASVPEVVVRGDGKITVPLIKEVDVAGYTPKELEKILTDRFAKLVREPDVTVIPRKIASSKVYVLGAVKKEGPVILGGPTTILQAITEAGGLNEYAKRKKIYVLRNENGKQLRFPFDYQAVVRGESTAQNILVKPDDTIVVPQ